MSVMRVYCDKMTEARIMRFPLKCSTLPQCHGTFTSLYLSRDSASNDVSNVVVYDVLVMHAIVVQLSIFSSVFGS